MPDNKQGNRGGYTGLQNNALFRLIDRIPFIRRSGTASMSDLAKAVTITLVISLLPSIPLFIQHPIYLLFVALVLGPVVGLILLAHPFLSHRATLRQSFGLAKREDTTQG